MEENIEYLKHIYSLALAKGLCRNKGDFAECLSMNKSTISGAFAGNPKYLTDGFMRRLHNWARQVDLEKPASPAHEQPKQPDIIIPAATATLYNNMSETIRIQAELIARLQAGMPAAFTGAYNQKNFRPDGK